MAKIQLKSKAPKQAGSKQITAVLEVEAVDYTLDIDDGTVLGFTGGPITGLSITPKPPRALHWRFVLGLLYYRKLADEAAGVLPSGFTLN